MLSRSPIRVGEKYQVHSKGATLSCNGYKLLNRLFLRRLTDRDPIDTDIFLATLSSTPSEKDTDLKDFQQWMADLGVTQNTVQKDIRTVCPPFLVGDCLPFRKGEYCKHGHPRMKPGVHPLNHQMVLNGGECIHLGPGGVVKVSAILGYDDRIQDSTYPCLRLGPERDEGVKECVRGAECSWRWDCIYFHSED